MKRHSQLLQPVQNPLEKSCDSTFILKKDGLIQSQYKDSNLIEQNIKIRTDITTIRAQLNKYIDKTKQRLFTDEQLASRSRISKFTSNNNLQLDPMDEKVIIPFDCSYFSQMKKSNFQVSIEPFENQLRDWLVDITQTILSITYNHLRKEVFIQKQAKNFVCKNILQNIKIFFQRYNEIPLESRYDLMKFINQELNHIFQHIAKKYPLTSSRGVSKRIKSKVQKIDNRESVEYDFLVKQNLNIVYREDGDYSEDIMKIINKLISYTSEPYDPRMELQQTNYQIFTEIMEHIFDNAGLQEASLTAKEIISFIYGKMGKFDEDNHSMSKTLRKDTKNSQCQQRLFFDNKRSSIISRDPQKHVLIGHKIPIGTPLFSDQDIQSSNFKSFDSSILRLLTKWTNQLRMKIVNAQQTILRRVFKFKNDKGRLINLQPIMKEYLYQAALKQIEGIEQYKKYLKRQNYYLQTIFSQQLNRAKYAKNDTRVGIYAAKLNQIASQYIFKYINRLIHSLLTIPRVAAQKITNDREKALLNSVNLITFKIGDLIRCKCSCSEQEFMKILMTLDELHITAPEILKIVRIKNRLQTQNNDLLFNLFFGNKAQCQLQLSVFSNEKKNITNQSIFSHIIYQIQRAEIGPISEMANIIVQFDPLARQYSKKKSYRPQLINYYQKDINNKKNDQILEKREYFKKKMKIGTNIELPFVCCKCGELVTVHNRFFLKRNLPILTGKCNSCIAQFYRSISKKNQDIQTQLEEHMLRQNFTNEETIQFFKNHLYHWQKQQMIKGIEEQTDSTVSTKWFPSQGYMIRVKQKRPILQLFTCIYQQSISYAVFAKMDEQGNKKLLAGIKINCQKQKKIKNILKELQQFIIFELRDTQSLTEDGIKYFKCKRQNCCGIKINPGPVLEKQQMKQFTHENIVARLFQHQIASLNMNYINNCLGKVENYISSVKEKNVLWKIRNTVQLIEAYSCNLTHIKIVGIFVQLTDLNIGKNPQIKSLKGIQTCFNLKFLNCKNCDLANIDELSKLKKLEQLNFTNNRRLDSLECLTDHTQLINLYIRNTAVSTLQPLQKCYKLQSLDLQGCSLITTIKYINSKQLSYISIINCLSIEQFDLPENVTKSLKNIQIYKTDLQKMMANMVAEYSFKLEEQMRNDEVQVYTNHDIHKINRILKIRRTASQIKEQNDVNK